MWIEVDCERIRHNAAAVVDLCAQHGIEVAGVTKACCGHPEVARAILAGGVPMLADSRLKHISRMRGAGIDAPVLLLRLPRISRAEEVVRLTQVSLNSEVETVRHLSAAAEAHGLTHKVILMVELGDRREGIMPEGVVDAAREVLGLPGIELVGIGANTACIGGVLPTRKNMERLVEVSRAAEDALDHQLDWISGGHTGNLDLMMEGEHPSGVNHLRVGEAILQGVDSRTNYPLPLPYQDTLIVKAEVIEVKTKPSLPEGKPSTDALGRVPEWEDHGIRRRAILALGEQDLRVSGLEPKRSDITIVGASSDHLVVDVTEAYPAVGLGDVLAFHPYYAAMATGMAAYGPERRIHPIAGREERPEAGS